LNEAIALYATEPLDSAEGFLHASGASSFLELILGSPPAR
jgi:hypothetical protein